MILLELQFLLLPKEIHQVMSRLLLWKFCLHTMDSIYVTVLAMCIDIVVPCAIKHVYACIEGKETIKYLTCHISLSSSHTHISIPHAYLH